MTAPASIHPRPVDDLYPGALALADQLGEVPSRNRLMKEFRIGVPKATELRERLIAGTARPTAPTVAEPVAVPFDYAEPIGPDLLPDPAAPEPVPADEPDPTEPEQSRGWFRRRNRPKASTQVRGNGHPGTPPVAKTPPPPVKTAPAAAEPAPAGADERASLLRIRWAVRAVLALGVAASIAGNVLHARDELISQIISAWSPLALLLTIELISRVPVHRRLLALARWAATTLIAGIAGWVSYWHMAAVASHYGETNGSQYLLPLSVDGLVVVASICLVELGGRIASASKAAAR